MGCISMKRSELYKLMGVYLDLAAEAHEILRGEAGTEVPGVKMTEQSFEEATIKTVTIFNEQGAAIMGRPQGSYITLDSAELRDNDKMVHKRIGEMLAEKLKEVLQLKEDSTV